jgi:hypothetical protein
MYACLFVCLQRTSKLQQRFIDTSRLHLQAAGKHSDMKGLSVCLRVSQQSLNFLIYEAVGRKEGADG